MLAAAFPTLLLGSLLQVVSDLLRLFEELVPVVMLRMYHGAPSCGLISFFTTCSVIITGYTFCDALARVPNRLESQEGFVERSGYAFPTRDFSRRKCETSDCRRSRNRTKNPQCFFSVQARRCHVLNCSLNGYSQLLYSENHDRL
jgi:hypothetical protein